MIAAYSHWTLFATKCIVISATLRAINKNLSRASFLSWRVTSDDVDLWKLNVMKKNPSVDCDDQPAPSIFRAPAYNQYFF
jgi:hypothetical protein